MRESDLTRGDSYTSILSYPQSSDGHFGEPSSRSIVGNSADGIICVVFTMNLVFLSVKWLRVFRQGSSRDWRFCS